jgi:hypothetical protein
VWVRAYSGGITVVNPSEEDGVVVALDEVYLDSEVGEVAVVTLDRGRGRILSLP